MHWIKARYFKFPMTVPVLIWPRFGNRLKESRTENLLDPLIGIGTFSLDTLHRSFQSGDKATD